MVTPYRAWISDRSWTPHLALIATEVCPAAKFIHRVWIAFWTWIGHRPWSPPSSFDLMSDLNSQLGNEPNIWLKLPILSGSLDYLS